MRLSARESNPRSYYGDIGNGRQQQTSCQLGRWNRQNHGIESSSHTSYQVVVNIYPWPYILVYSYY